MRMAGEMVGWENVLGLQKYGPRFRAYRKHFSRAIGARAQLEPLYPLFEQAGRQMIKNMLKTPEKFPDALRRHFLLAN
jgi:hypothetical protein